MYERAKINCENDVDEILCNEYLLDTIDVVHFFSKKNFIRKSLPRYMYTVVKSPINRRN